ncbi:hypothetical protein LOK49_LG12G01819 [Camellia lanceoleosa]|uniref:Uncharacterized protein n=1 Tax=Camellia lanceoleosa TaxID=1840588 RepID=A0ACC0FRV5_9ERIC|nr:hypothetical protein LOK49_LG12G01819 [Camellia lanceoleosa]
MLPLANAYGLAKHRDGRWEWAIAPSVSPFPRYQHAAVFVNTRLRVSGGALGGGRMVEDSSSVAGIFPYFLFPCNPAYVLKLLVYKIYNQEHRAMLENETLRRQVQELRNFLPLCEHSGMPYQEYFPAQRNNSLLSHGAVSPDTVYNCVVDLQLGSIFVSSYAMNFDYHALEGYDLVLYFDFSLVNVMEDTDNDNYFAPAANNFSATSPRLMAPLGFTCPAPVAKTPAAEWIRVAIPPTCGQTMEVPDITVKFTLPTCLYVYSSKVLNYKKQSAVYEASV